VTISVVLRLSPAGLVEGQLAGAAVLAETGERTVVADAAELIAFVADRPPVVPPCPKPRSRLSNPVIGMAVESG
jgi:hypothetical protein